MRTTLSVLLLLGAALFGILPSANGAAVQKLTLTMGDYFYRPATLTLQAGVPAEITMTNRGKKEHEFMLYAMPMAGMMRMALHGWAERTTYFKGVPVTVEGKGVEPEHMGGALVEIMLPPGTRAVVTFTPMRTGKFEMACLIKGHYERGQKGVLIVQ